MTNKNLTFTNFILDIHLYCNCNHCSKLCVKHKYCKSTCIYIDINCKKDAYWQKSYFN